VYKRQVFLCGKFENRPSRAADRFLLKKPFAIK